VLQCSHLPYRPRHQQRIVTGCLRLTPADNLPILAGILPAEFRCNGATLSISHHAMEPGHLLHSVLTGLPAQMDGVLNCDTLLCLPHNNSSVHLTTTTYVRHIGWIINGRRSGWTALRESAPALTLPRTVWVRLDHLCTGVVRFCSCLHKWGMASSAACECGAEGQTVDHVVLLCPIHRSDGSG